MTMGPAPRAIVSSSMAFEMAMSVRLRRSWGVSGASPEAIAP
jgi:hypothetical protein